jgi:outer membrane immunogenic protein
MKQLLVSAIAALGLIGTPAFAADMAVKAPPPAPAPLYNWTGFYAGLNFGVGWGTSNNATTTSTPLVDDLAQFFPGTTPSGSTAGGQFRHREGEPEWPNRRRPIRLQLAV